MDPLQLIPFQFLPLAERTHLLSHSERLSFTAGEVLIDATLEESTLPVYLLREGSVRVLDRGREVGRIEAPAYFGERGPLFGQRQASVYAYEDVVVDRIPAGVFLGLIERCPAFRVALSDLMRSKQRIFDAFDRFLAEVRHGISRGHVIIPRLLHLYRPLSPALHPGVDVDAIDFGALGYAVNRLPENLTETYCWFLTWDVPVELEPHQQHFTHVDTRSRRRSVIGVQPGKNLVVLRDGESDVIDLIACLCLYSVEARKIRMRVHDPDSIERLLSNEDPLGSFSDAERDGLSRLWGERAAQRVRQLVLHHEDFAVHVHRGADNYNADHADRWTHQIAEATLAVHGFRPHDLPAGCEVHIISSNTHSVTNCLSPWLQRHRDEILAWGRRHRGELVGLAWTEEQDLVVALARDYLAAHPQADRAAVDDCSGRVLLRDTAYTGIEVQLFDIAALRDQDIDPALPRPVGRHGVIVNIDYAFGEQARHILASLIALFGPRITSINVLGKAGGLVGSRGDLLVCNGFIEQLEGRVHRPKGALDVDRLRARIPDRSVHVGRTLTVAGTLLQNEVLLRFYQRVWDCVGLEMEGAHYAGEIERAERLELLADVDQRYVYYVSDLPLDPTESLASSLSSHEGVPPLYAATREVLSAVLGGRPTPSTPPSRVPKAWPKPVATEG